MKVSHAPHAEIGGFDALGAAPTGRLLFVARAMMAALPLFGGVEKLFRYSDAVAFATSYGLPFARETMPAAIVLELGAGALLLPSRTCRGAAAVLAVWTLFLGIWFHRFWAAPADQWQTTVDGFFHHSVMVGAYVYVALLGRGVAAPTGEGGMGAGRL